MLKASASAGSGWPPLAGELPELAGVPWRRRVDESALRRADRLWTLGTVAHELPFLLAAVALPALNAIMIPVAVAALAFAWVIPELYAARGAGVLRVPGPPAPGGQAAERRALGLLADLVGHDARELLRRTGLVLERGRLGVWLVGPAGALLVRPGGRRVQTYCVRTTGDALPVSDLIAQLLLALRADESGFATVANLTFSGARWRLGRRLRPAARQGLAAAAAAAR
ncbi:MAG TPA: hypothetical protein VG365_09355 [Solirubrobacteraceae bacterium]|nr:hypothetical protein [Solirubrobacteraceae bacterium]